MSEYGTEVPGLPQPPDVHAPTMPMRAHGFAKTVAGPNPFGKTMIGGPLLAKIQRGKAGAGLRAARKAAREAAQRNRAALKGLRAQRRAIRALTASSKRALAAKRKQLRAAKARLRALKAAHPGSHFNKARGGYLKTPGRRSSSRGGSFVTWAVRKALRALKGRGIGDGRNHGFTGVRKAGRTGLAGR